MSEIVLRELLKITLLQHSQFTAVNLIDLKLKVAQFVLVALLLLLTGLLKQAGYLFKA